MDKTMTPEDAYNILVSDVHAPVFFEKLARVYGIKPNTQEEARELLLMAGQLRNAHEQNEVKQASARTSYFANARKDLNDVLTKSGYATIGENGDTHVKEAADNAVASNPVIREAALVFGQFMANQLNG